MPLALVGGAIIAVVLIGTVAGFNLMFPAVAYDGSDYFDAVNRSFSYLRARPWRLAFYSIVAAVYGAACYLFVRLFAFVILFGSRFFVRAGLWKEIGGVNKLDIIWPRPTYSDFCGSALPAAAWTQSVSALLIHLFSFAMVCLVAAFIVSFYFSANTIIYSLIRYKTDNVAVTEVYTDNADNISTEPMKTEPQAEQS